MLLTDLSPQVGFLSDAAHLLATTLPEISAFLMSRRNELLVENDVPIPDTQRQHVCSCCGRIMIPGQDSTTLNIETEKALRSRTKKRARPQHTRSQAVMPSAKRATPGGVAKVVTCGNCGRHTRISLPGPGRILRNKRVAQQRQAAQEKESKAPEPAKASSANASSRKRAKNRKAGLQALLDQKQGSSSSSGFGLSLSDFMKK